MNDEQLIFEKYLQTLNLLSEAEYESRFKTSQGMGRTKFTAREAGKQSNQFHDANLGVALEMGDYIDLTDKIPSFNSKKLSQIVGVRNDQPSIFNHYSKEYGAAHFGIIPMFKLPNVINRMRTLISSGGIKDKQFNQIKQVLERAYKEDEATADKYSETGYLPEWRSYEEYTDLTTGKKRPAVLGGYSQKQAITKADGSTGYGPDVRGLPEPLASNLTNQYGKLAPERNIRLSTQGPPKPGKPRKSALATKEKDVERRDELTKPTPKKKKPAKEVSKESFIRDDIAF